MRWGVISDIHGNLTALESALDELRRFGAERYVCLGDLVGYGPQPNEVVRAVRELEPIVVAGNHDLAVVGELHLDWFAAIPRACLEWTISVLDADAVAFLGGLPRTADLAGVRLVHALPPTSATTYLTLDALATLSASLGEWLEDLCFVGHTHRPQCVLLPADMPASEVPPADIGGRPAERELILQPLLSPWRPPALRERVIVNLGSVGQPRDGDPRAFCALWDDERRTLEARRVAYDVESVIERMASAGLPTEPALRLRTGS